MGQISKNSNHNQPNRSDIIRDYSSCLVAVKFSRSFTSFERNLDKAIKGVLHDGKKNTSTRRSGGY